MKKFRLIWFIFFILSCEDIGKDYSWEGKLAPGFTRTFGTQGYDYGWSVAYSRFDEGIILTGKRSPEIFGQSDLWAIKTNNRGIMEWEKSFGAERNEEGYDVIATSDGGFLFVGYSWSFGNAQQVYVIKTDFYGNTSWEKNYGGSMWEVGQSVIEVAEGSFVIGGFSNSPGISSGNTDMYLLKIDKDGNKVWEKSYGNLVYPNHEWIFDITENFDGGFILVGARDRYDKGSLNGLIVRTDKDGNKIWEKELADSANISESIYSIARNRSGEFYICSSINSVNSPNLFKPKIIKMDASGNFDWTRVYNSRSKKYHRFNIAPTNSGGIIMVGSSSNTGTKGYNEDAFMTKINSNGDIIWSSPYGTADNDDWGWSVFETPRSNLVFVGSTKSFGGSLFDIFLTGTNKDGLSE